MNGHSWSKLVDGIAVEFREDPTGTVMVRVLLDATHPWHGADLDTVLASAGGFPGLVASEAGPRGLWSLVIDMSEALTSHTLEGLEGIVRDSVDIVTYAMFRAGASGDAE